MRFSEFYENIDWQGKVFSREEFTEYYLAKTGKPYIWEGFNLPSHILKPFLKGRFDPLSEGEKRLLNILSNEPHPFYVIGVATGKWDLATLKHEIVHGLYYINDRYHQDVSACLERFDLKDLNVVLSVMLYHPAVWEDEANSYILTGLGKHMKHLKESLKPIQLELRKVFRHHFGYSIARAGLPFMLEQVRRIKLPLS